MTAILMSTDARTAGGASEPRSPLHPVPGPVADAFRDWARLILAIDGAQTCASTLSDTSTRPGVPVERLHETTFWDGRELYDASSSTDWHFGLLLDRFRADAPPYVLALTGDFGTLRDPDPDRVATLRRLLTEMGDNPKDLEEFDLG